jgi:hypothetical protein
MCGLFSFINVEEIINFIKNQLRPINFKIYIKKNKKEEELFIHFCGTSIIFLKKLLNFTYSSKSIKQKLLCRFKKSPSCISNN